MPLPRLQADDIGQPQISGATVQEGSSVLITAGGADIWGTRDECQFAYLDVTGDFDMSVRVAALEMADTYTKAGLMLRTSLDEGAAHAMLLTFGDNQPRNKNNGALEFQSRLVAGGECSGIYPPQPLADEPQFPASFPQHWLRLTRQGDVLTGLFSTDGQAWQTFCTHIQVFPASALLGLAVTSHNTARAVRASFHDLTLNQGSTP
jgi:regulation of enolase protein 1 (concanavalin A-like superfamily)